MNWKGARPPLAEPLEGAFVNLEPLHAELHGPALFAASHGPAADPRLWEYLPYGPFSSEDEFVEWARERAKGADPLFFAVTERRPHAPSASGVASYLRMDPPNGVIELGHIWFGAGLQRTQGATEAIFLLARHAFDELGYRRLEWKCDADNARSRRAAERLGFEFEGVFRQHMVVKGRNRDSAWYALLDRDWPAVRSGFEAWLAPQNFDGVGHQRRALRALRAGSGP